jgi:hypothetical protein
MYLNAPKNFKFSNLLIALVLQTCLINPLFAQGQQGGQQGGHTMHLII